MKGMTIIELLVALSIFILGVAGFSLLFSKTWQQNSYILETGQTSMTASNTLSKMIKDLRQVKQSDNGHFGIKSADDFDLTVYLDDDNDGITEQVHYFLDLTNQQLKKGISKPSGSPLVYPATDQNVQVLANHMVNTSSQPIFSYYNENYPGDIVNNPLSIPITLPDVRLIQIHLWINIKPNSAPDNLNLQSFVELRNLNENQ